MYELNSSGKYFAFKEQLKYAVIKIVREKYLRTTSFANQEQLQVSFAFNFQPLADLVATESLCSFWCFRQQVSGQQTLDRLSLVMFKIIACWNS